MDADAVKLHDDVPKDVQDRLADHKLKFADLPPLMQRACCGIQDMSLIQLIITKSPSSLSKWTYKLNNGRYSNDI